MPDDTDVNSVRLKEGAPIPTMQRVITRPEQEKGAPIPKLQPVKPPQTPAKPSSQDDTGGQAGSATSGNRNQ